MKSFFSKKRNWMVAALLFIFLLLIIFFIIYFIIPSFNDNNYGSRLDNENKYKIQTKVVNEIKSEVSKEEGVKEITYHKAGRVLNFTISFEKEMELDQAKKYADKVTEKLSDKNKEYYDVQVFLDAEGKQYPIIGYRSKGKDSGISWGNVGENK